MSLFWTEGQSVLQIWNILPQCNTEALEKFLKDAVGDQLKLGAKLHPKYTNIYIVMQLKNR